MLLKYILLGFFIYVMFKLLFDFIIPVVRTTKMVKKQFDAVKEQQFNQQRQGPPPSTQSGTPADHDYIEFEEVT